MRTLLYNIHDSKETEMGSLIPAEVRWDRESFTLTELKYILFNLNLLNCHT